MARVAEGAECGAPRLDRIDRDFGQRRRSRGAAGTRRQGVGCSPCDSGQADPVGFRCARDAASRRHLAAGLGSRAGVDDRCRGGDRPRGMEVRSLQGEEGKAGAALRLARGRRPRARDGRDRGDLDGARSHHHAVFGHGAGRAGGGGAGAGQGAQGAGKGDRGRRAAQAELSHGPYRGPRQHAGAAADRSGVGPRERSKGDSGRQGRVLRHRRPRPESSGRHAEHEEGHGWCRHRARRGRDGDGGQVAGAPARAGAGSREFGVRQCLPAARRGADTQGAVGGDRQRYIRVGRNSPPGRRACPRPRA